LSVRDYILAQKRAETLAPLVRRLRALAETHVLGFRAGRLVMLAALVLFLAWEILTRGVGAYFGGARTATTLWSTYPTVSLNLVDSRLNRAPPVEAAEPGLTPGPDPETAARLRETVESALSDDPLNARALRLLGQIADVAGDDDQAERFMEAATRRSLQESIAVAWLVQRNYYKQDYAASLRYADVLLRTRPQFIMQLMPMLGATAESKDGNAALKQVLAANPPWRNQFLDYLPAHISDARTPLGLLLSLKNTSTPPGIDDIRGYIDFLVARKFYELAYYTWLQFLPGEQLGNAGLLFNGSFELAPSRLPFDWVIASGAGVTADLAEQPDGEGGRALFIEFGHGRVDFRGVKQLVMLGPGKYQLQGKYKGKIVGRRGLVWRVACANDPTAAPIGESAMVTGVASAWEDFKFSFTVPNADCRAQSVWLALDARSESEQFVSGSIWYDELRIVRASGGGTP
jgi:hypothetical protein